MSKKRVSLTLEEELLKRMDAEADHKSLNRSQMFEEVVEEYIHGQEIDTAVIFCGGEEKRSLKSVDGRPVLSHIVEHLKDNNISRLVLLPGKNEEEIRDRFSYGMDVEYVSEEEPRGTASALKKLGDRIGKTFLAVNGDVIARADIADMLKVHREEGRKATMALTTVEDPSEYGTVKLKGRKVLGFEEKPEPGEEPTKLVNAGTYIFEPSIFDELSDGGLDSVFEKLSSSGELSGYIYGGEWRRP
ncbi:MAG: sugar phosphate nucleotidyltransferase [Candidatus Nanohaloarchaea archaeon]